MRRVGVSVSVTSARRMSLAWDVTDADAPTRRVIDAIATMAPR